MKKLVKYLIYFWIYFFAGISLMGITRHVYLGGKTINQPTRDIVTFLASLPSNIINFKKLNDSQLIIMDEFNQKNGFTYNRREIPNDYLLISVWDKETEQSIIKLINIKYGETVYRWKINIPEINNEFNNYEINGLKNNLSVKSTRIFHPYLMNDGSIILDAGGLYKIDRYGKYIWKNSKIKRHHSLETIDGKYFWSCGYSNSNIKAQKFSVRDYCILKIDGENGNVVYTKPIFNIFIENGYNLGQLLTSNGSEESIRGNIDHFHLNDIEPVMTSSKYWKKGDLFISLRNNNTVFLYRPSTNKIIWIQVGPWLKQHDVDIIDSNKIGIFGNDVLDGDFNNKENVFINKTNHHYIYDFKTNKITTPYNLLFNNSNIKTILEGRSKIIKNKGIFIEETCRGRLLFGDQKSLIWSYIEKVDEDHLSMFSWSRYITEEEFSKFTFLKNK